ESTQEEFFHTFNDLYQHNKQIVITSDKPPSEMATLEDRLRTRFSEGLICDIQVPTYETIRAILDNKIEKKKGLDIPEDVKDYIASNVKSSIRELEGAINNLSAFASLSGSPITLSLAQEALKDLISSNNKREVNVELIMEIVAEHFHISINDLVSSKRNASISKPRQIVMYLCRQMTQESALNIAKKLGKKDHSTVIHGAKAITEELLTDENLKNTINILIKKIDPN
ncbi:MAG: chromosomal replication initiator protein DnaA, partial [Lachnospiraceae bacterium]|nr:chromosomal replication initiator protein DnaA [Lachnospiraceae bacterium]